MLTWLDSVPFVLIIMLCLTLGLAPFSPEPHIVEKLRMLSMGQLVRPIDIFDLLFHAAPFLLLGLKLLRMMTGGSGA